MTLSTADRLFWNDMDWAEYMNNCRNLPAHMHSIRAHYAALKAKHSEALSDCEKYFIKAYDYHVGYWRERR